MYHTQHNVAVLLGKAATCTLVSVVVGISGMIDIIVERTSDVQGEWVWEVQESAFWDHQFVVAESVRG